MCVCKCGWVGGWAWVGVGEEWGRSWGVHGSKPPNVTMSDLCIARQRYHPATRARAVQSARRRRGRGNRHLGVDRVRHQPPRDDLLFGPDAWGRRVSHRLGRDADGLAYQQPARARTLRVVLNLRGVRAPGTRCDAYVCVPRVKKGGWVAIGALRAWASAWRGHVTWRELDFHSSSRTR